MRLDNLRRLMIEQGLDGLLVSAPINQHYLLGTGSDINAFSLITSDRAIVFTDGRFIDALGDIDKELIPQQLDVALVRHLGPYLKPVATLGFEAERISWALWSALDQCARDHHAKLQATYRLVESLRSVKEPAELDLIRRAAHILDQAYDLVRKSLGSSLSEIEMAWQIEQCLRAAGADNLSFPAIVAFAANGALPHAAPTADVIEGPGALVVDIGAKIQGYCSDCTRTFAVGEIDEQMVSIYQLVRQAQSEALALVRAGARCRDVHQRAREVIADAGYGQFFNHGTGHGVGLEIHEEPRLRADRDDLLQSNQVITIEPGIYLPEQFGVRLEELVVVCDDGYELLTQAPYIL